MFPFSLLITVIFTGASMTASDSHHRPSDRERNGLRGPVKLCSEERVRTYDSSVESSTYAGDGRILERRRNQGDKSEWVTTYKYDDQLRLVSETNTSSRQAPVEQAYSYDEQGRMTKVVKFPALPPSPANTAVAAAQWEDSGLNFGPWDGGTLTTIYNEDGKAMEGEFRNLQGQLVVRLLRTFDAKGNVIEEKLRNELDPSGIPYSMVQTLKELPSEFNEAQKKTFGAFLAKAFVGAGATYTYDERARLTKKRIRRGAIGDETTALEYNEHGDVSKEIIITQQPDSRERNIDEEGVIHVVPRDPSLPGAPSTQSEAMYTYDYDSFGNWTRRITSRRSKSDETWAETETVNREITYY